MLFTVSLFSCVWWCWRYIVPVTGVLCVQDERAARERRAREEEERRRAAEEQRRRAEGTEEHRRAEEARAAAEAARQKAEARLKVRVFLWGVTAGTVCCHGVKRTLLGAGMRFFHLHI